MPDFEPIHENFFINNNTFFSTNDFGCNFYNKTAQLYCMDYLGFLTLTFFVNIISQYILKISSNQRTITFNLFQVDLAKRMMSAKLEELESRDFLDLKAKAEQYIYGGGQGFASVLENSFEIFGTIVSIILYGAVISTLHPVILLILFFAIVINVFCNSIYQKKNIEINLEKSVQERNAAYYSAVFQDFSYGKEIRSNDLRFWLLNKYNIQLKKMQMFYKRLNRNNFLYATISVTISVIQQIISYIYLVFQTIRNGITVGTFSLYLNAILSFNNAIKTVVGQVISIRQYTLYYESYQKYISVEDIFESNDKQFTLSFQDDFVIEFHNVSFRYPNNSYYSLKNINVTIRKNDRVLIVGSNGAGKSTFVKLLLRIYKPTSGYITINGVEIDTIPYKDYLKLFSTVFQDYKLFAENVRENITFKSENPIEDAKVMTILEYLGMSEKIKGLGEVLDTSIYKIFDENGYTPSGGEAQKIDFARAIYKDALVFVLDEPTASLDPQAELEIYNIFNDMVVNKTCFFISHRLAIAAFSTHILVFDNGQLIESGSHKELIAQKGKYFSMYTMQTKYYDVSFGKEF